MFRTCMRWYRAPVAFPRLISLVHILLSHPQSIIQTNYLVKMGLLEFLYRKKDRYMHNKFKINNDTICLNGQQPSCVFRPKFYPAWSSEIQCSSFLMCKYFTVVMHCRYSLRELLVIRFVWKNCVYWRNPVSFRFAKNSNDIEWNYSPII